VPAGADALVQLAGTAVPAPSLYGAQVLGRAQPSSALRLDIFLRPDDAAGLQSLAGAVSSPGNPVPRLESYAPGSTSSSSTLATVQPTCRHGGWIGRP